MPSAAFASALSTFWNQLRWPISLPSLLTTVPSVSPFSSRIFFFHARTLSARSKQISHCNPLPYFRPSILSISFFSLPSILSFILYGIRNSLRLFENLPFLFFSSRHKELFSLFPDSHMRLWLNASGQNKKSCERQQCLVGRMGQTCTLSVPFSHSVSLFSEWVFRVWRKSLSVGVRQITWEGERITESQGEKLLQALTLLKPR